MGNKPSGRKKKKIKGTGSEFSNEKIEVKSNKHRKSIIRYDSNVIVSEVKSDPFEDYQVVKTIGKGAFGEVQLVEHKLTGKVRAMKLIKKSDIADEESILNEFNTLKKIDHQNILKIFEYYSDKEYYYLVTEYCSGGDLLQVMKSQFLSEMQVACIIYQILLALNNIHKLKIIHRDLKLENILVTKKEEDGLYRVKICDFGTSHFFRDGEKEKYMAGSSYYIAPEVFKRKYDFKCDLWSTGVIMYVLLTKKIPFFGEDEKQIQKNIVKKTYNAEPLKSFSKYSQDLIADLLEKDPDKRLNAEEALTYEIFKAFKCKETINKVDKKEIQLYIDNIKKFKKGNALQEAAISYLIHNSDFDEISGAFKFYNKLDNNDNGKIGFMEFYDGLCEISGEKLNQDEVKQIFLNLDSNSNGYFEQEEFVKAAVDKKLYLSEKMIKFVFNFFDQDKSGIITIDEIINVFKDNVLDDFEALDEFKRIVSSVDKDSDGKIDYEEFAGFMKTLLE